MPVNYWITVSYGELLAGSVPVATTADPVIVRLVLVGLCDNRTLEEDRHDRVEKPEFYALARAASDALGETIRRDACRVLPDGDPEERRDQDGVPPPARRPPLIEAG